MADQKIKVIATNTIIKTVKAGVRGDRNKGDPGTKPEVLTIEPGSVFMADNVRHGGALRSEYDELLASGSIRDWTQEDEDVFKRMSNVIGGGEFTDNFKVSETVVSANEGQTVTEDPSGTGQNTAAKKTTAPAAKKKLTEGEIAAANAKADEDAKVKEAEAAAAAKAKEDADKAAAQNKGKPGKAGAATDTDKEDDVV
jgi:hypothetical protein